MTINTSSSYHITKSALPESKNVRFIESYVNKFKTDRPAKTLNWPDLITRDMATTSDKNLQRATLIDKLLSKKQYTQAHQEICKIADLDLKEFYTIEIIHHVLTLNKSFAELATLSLRPSVIKDTYLAELGLSYLKENNPSQAKVMPEAMTVPAAKAHLLNHLQTQNLADDSDTIFRLALLCKSIKIITYRQAEREINKIHDPSSQDPFRAKIGEILFRNQKSSDALALVQEITDTSKKDETYARFVEIAEEFKQLKKALFFLDLITTTVSHFDKLTKKDEILAQIVDDYLYLNNAPDSIPFFDKIQDKNLKNTVKERILAAYRSYSESSTNTSLNP